MANCTQHFIRNPRIDINTLISPAIILDTNSQIIRLRRLCMDDVDYSEKVDDLISSLSTRNYPNNVLTHTKQKSLTLTRNSTLQKRQRDNIERPPAFVTTFSSRLQHCNSILRRHYYLLNSDPKLRKLFSSPPVVVYRRNCNLGNILMNRHITHTDSPGCKPCNDKRCLTCQHMQTTDHVSSVSTNYIVRIKRAFDCKSANVVYCIECSLCGKQYIGETKQEFHKRISSHRYDILHKTDTAIAEHFNLPGHDMTSHLKTYVIQGNFRKDRERKYREGFLIFKFNSLVPGGMNRSTGWLSSVHCIPK